MVTSQEVFQTRKSGQLAKALNMGRELVENDPNDIWNAKALAWTLIDLIKDAFKKNDTNSLNDLVSELKSLNLDESDNILMGQVEYVLSLSNPIKKAIDEVFQKRKSGLLIDALNLGRNLIKQCPHDEWCVKALAWTIIDLIKIAYEKKDFQFLDSLGLELKALHIDRTDEILMKSVNYAFLLADPRLRVATDAKQLSKQGNHKEAIRAFKIALENFPEDENLYESLGWEYYKYGKDFFQNDNINVHAAKQLLYQYIILKNPRPSRLHSLFLRLSDKLLGKEGFNLVSFLQQWDLNNLTDEDFEEYHAENGNIYPSIAEKVIQHAAKDALESDNLEYMEYILPFLDMAIKRFSENIWLTFYKAKLLHALQRDNEALPFAKLIVKSKNNDYWAWELLGEILMTTDPEKGFSCYCKALMCKGEEKFMANVRLRFAELLIEKSMFSEAKYEVVKAIKSREKGGYKTTQQALEYQQSDWFNTVNSSKDNLSLYKKNIDLAESLLFDELPWLEANVGQSYTANNNPKPKRKLFVSFSNDSMPKEVSFPENKYNFKDFGIGAPIAIKGEYEASGRFVLYILKERDGGKIWDTVPKYIGVIDHVNYDKKLAHFIIDKSIDGVVRFNDFALKFTVGQYISVQLTEYQSKMRKRFNVISCEFTDELPDKVLKSFSGSIRESNGLGFTDDDIFIDRDLMMYHNLEDEDSVEGLAVLNYNKKKNNWGWKALKVEHIFRGDA